MEKLATETLQQIFEHACTDGGYTGCSLSLTSTSIRKVARPVRFFSVALILWTHSVNAFLALYKKECSVASGTRPKLAHLCLSDIREDSSIDDDPESWEVITPDHSDVLTATRHLLALVGDGLKSLVIDRAFVYPGNTLANRQFPSLRELTCLGYCHPSLLDVPRGVYPLFPALKRLHVVVGEELRNKPLIPQWATHAPHLTHLRISARHLSDIFLDEISEIVEAASDSRHDPLDTTVDASSAGRTFPRLARVVVQPGPRPVKGACRTSRSEFSSMLSELYEFADDATQAGLEMFALSPCKWSKRQWNEEIHTEWVKTIGGEDGRDWFSDEESEDESEGSKT
ncbi:hypothetical protein BD310DRAFT_886176 [Dichomitus squalens]|uniref:F-box domain-containing protein n=1 Tax=Dichomitus squalens TaxID=114155 RepID=A0A4Q9PK01_9APHY|nr:hypothetical protein BD310DRAFT_886176 [Dichomitus squalens]